MLRTEMGSFKLDADIAGQLETFKKTDIARQELTEVSPL